MSLNSLQENATNYNITSEIVFDSFWGSYGSLPGQLNTPRDIAIGTDNRYYITERDNHRVQVFNSSGSHLFAFGSYGTGEGEFDWPHSISIDSDGKVFVADKRNNRIQVFNADGNFLSSFGSYGTGEGEFNSPSGIAVNDTNYIYVADTQNHRIQVFDSNFNYLFQWGSYGTNQGEFKQCNYINFDKNGNVFVSDRNNHRIQVFDSNGNFMYSLGSYGDNNGEFNLPHGISFDNKGRIYVTDIGNDRIQVFTPDGEYLFSIGEEGTNELQFASPSALTIVQDPIYTYLYIVEMDNHRVQVLKFKNYIVENISTIFSFDSPSSEPRSMVVNDGSMWNVIRGNSRLYRYNHSTHQVMEYYNTPYDATGMTLDCDHLWIASAHDEKLRKYDLEGNIANTITLPVAVHGGIACDDSYFWTADQVNDKIHQIDKESLTVIRSIDAPGPSVRGLEIIGDCLLVADVDESHLYLISPVNGTIYAEYILPFEKSWGITLDDESYVWVSTPSTNRIYKLDLNLKHLTNDPETSESTPYISSPADITYEEGETGNSISWTVGDQNPGVYNITLDGEIYVSETPWSNGTITINIDGLDIGTHSLSINVYDAFDNMGSDTVQVIVNATIEDISSPTISSPEDLSYVVGETGNSISWTVGDQNPGVYNITLDGEIYVSETPWSNGSIVLNVDGLYSGSHMVRIYVYDAFGNMVSDVVKINIVGQNHTDTSTVEIKTCFVLCSIILVAVLVKKRLKNRIIKDR